jgi:mono/diheme cytochrome c family protein
MKIGWLAFSAWLLGSGFAWGQGDSAVENIRQGHRLASELCSLCHLATPDQATLPIMHPPAPPFAKILRRKDFTADWLANFLKTTHRGLDEPNGMPNPRLADFQIKQIVAYMMSVRE